MKLMGNHMYRMRRENDIEAAVNKHLRKITKIIKHHPPDHIYTKTLVYWPHKAGGEIDGFDIQEFDLQDTLEGKGALKEILRNYGMKVAAVNRPEGLDVSAIPLAITISIETILTNSASEPNEVGDRRISGIPVLLVGGRLSNGKYNVKLLPIALTKTDLRVLGYPAPESLLQRIEEMRLKSIDFMAPFFEGFSSGEKPDKPFSVVK